jgi:hypothetical protein
MMTNGETESALEHVTVPRHSPSQSRWGAQDAALEFGRFRMLVRQRQLTADGIPVRLGTRAFDLLTVLLEANGSLGRQERAPFPCVARHLRFGRELESANLGVAQGAWQRP